MRRALSSTVVNDIFTEQPDHEVNTRDNSPTTHGQHTDKR
jgi:hypothetical protein